MTTTATQVSEKPLFRYEHEMCEPVIMWLRGQGFVCTRELLCRWFNPMDIAAGLWEPRISRRIPRLIESVAVELKLSNVAAVLRQATRNQSSVDRSFAALPADRCERIGAEARSRFSALGIGILSVERHAVIEVLPARRSAEGTHPRIAKNLWRKCYKEAKQVKGEQA